MASCPAVVTSITAGATTGTPLIIKGPLRQSLCRLPGGRTLCPVAPERVCAGSAMQAGSPEYRTGWHVNREPDSTACSHDRLACAPALATPPDDRSAARSATSETRCSLDEANGQTALDPASLPYACRTVCPIRSGPGVRRSGPRAAVAAFCPGLDPIRHFNFAGRTFGEPRRRVQVIGRLQGEHCCLSRVGAVARHAPRPAERSSARLCRRGNAARWHRSYSFNASTGYCRSRKEHCGHPRAAREIYAPSAHLHCLAGPGCPLAWPVHARRWRAWQ